MNKSIKYLLFTLLFSFQAICNDKQIDELPRLLGSGAEGTEFWFTVSPSLEDESGYQNFVLFYILSNEKATVNLEVPGKNVHQTITALPNQLNTFPVNWRLGDYMPYYKNGRTQSPKEQIYSAIGIHIYSDKPILVYTLIRYHASSDGFLVLPVNHLGKEYICTGYGNDPMFDSIWGYKLPTIVGITAPYNNTRVKFIMGGNSQSVTAGGLKPGKDTSFIMNQADVFMVNADKGISDLAGSKIIADKPVSVVSGHFCNNIPIGNQWCDYTAEMELPTNLWGTTYHVAGIPNRKYSSIIRIFAKEPNTTVYRDGDSIAFLKSSGGIIGEAYFETRIIPKDSIKRPVVIFADKPIGITLYNTGVKEDDYPLPNSDPFWMALLPDNLFSTDLKFCTPAVRGGRGFEENYMNLIYETDTSYSMPKDIMITEYGSDNSTTISNLDSRFPGKDIKFSYDFMGKKNAMRTLTLPTYGVFKIQSSKPFAAYAFGYDWCDSYGYPAGYSINMPDDTIKGTDTIPPLVTYTLDCDGSVRDGIVADMPNDSLIRTNLAQIIFDDYSSFNYDFNYSGFFGKSVSTSWSLSVRDRGNDAQAKIDFIDDSRNITSIQVKYIAPQVKIEADSVVFDTAYKKVTYFKQLTIRNVGFSGTLKCKFSLKNGKTGFFLPDSNKIYNIPPENSAQITIGFCPDSINVMIDTLVFSDTCKSFELCSVKGYVVVAIDSTLILYSYPRSLQFGKLPKDSSKTMTFYIQNKTTNYIGKITKLQLLKSIPLFKIDTSLLPFLVLPQKQVQVSVTCTGLDYGDFADNICINESKNIFNYLYVSVPKPVEVKEDFSINDLQILNNIKITPEPVTNQSVLSFYLTIPVELTLNLIDLQGKKIRELFDCRQCLIGWQEVKLEAGNLPAGVYFIEFIYNNQKFAKKFIIGSGGK